MRRCVATKRAGVPLAIAVLLGALATGACKAAPSSSDAAPRDANARDVPADLLQLYDETRVTLLADSTFGEPDESPAALVAPAGGGDVLAISDKATYRLGNDDRVRTRSALPVASSGAATAIGDAQHDGGGLVSLVTWGDDSATPAGTYLAFGDGDGAFSAKAMLRLGDAGLRARLVRGGEALSLLVTRPQAAILALELRDVSRASGLGAAEQVTAVPATAALGEVVRDGQRLLACTVGPARLANGSSHLAAQLLFIDRVGELPRTLDMTPSTRQARGGCRLAVGKQSLAAAFGIEAAAPGPDAEPDSAAADPTGVQVFSKAGAPRGSLWVLSLVPTLTHPLQLWFDANSERYLVLYRSAYLGGRLALAAYREDGEVVFRDALIPLAYEPGGLAAVAAMAPTGDPGVYRLLYGRKLPWDKRRLHMARVRVR